MLTATKGGKINISEEKDTKSVAEKFSKLIKQGDSSSYSIAAASIIAKVHRDEIMTAIDELYPQYDFASNKGYGTKLHMEALSIHGPCDIHRRSFSPVQRAGNK